MFWRVFWVSSWHLQFLALNILLQGEYFIYLGWFHTLSLPLKRRSLWLFVSSTLMPSLVLFCKWNCCVTLLILSLFQWTLSSELSVRMLFQLTSDTFLQFGSFFNSNPKLNCFAQSLFYLFSWFKDRALFMEGV